MIPSAMDVLVTGLATISLSFVQPAVSTILKAGVQLVALALATRILQAKRQKWSQWLCLHAVVVGLLVLLVNVLAFGHSGHRFAPGGQTIGALIAMLAGVLGAFRNLAEAAILDDDTMPPDSLLLAESVLSVVALVPIGILLGIVMVATDGVTARAAVSNLGNTLAEPAAIPVLLACSVTAYGKDAGKFWMIKYTSAQRQKMLAVTFPFVTWMIGLVVFYAGGEHHVPALGVGFLVPSSVVELSGFIIILAANIVVVLLKDRGSFAARWCKSAVDDRCCS